MVTRALFEKAVVGFTSFGKLSRTGHWWLISIFYHQLNIEVKMWASHPNKEALYDAKEVRPDKKRHFCFKFQDLKCSVMRY